MSASITLSHLAWSTPDGQSVLADVNLAFGPERTGIVGRNGVGKSVLLALIAGSLKPTSGHVARGGTIATMRQNAQVRDDATLADLFGVTQALARLRHAESGTATIEELADIDWMLESRVEAALAAMSVDADLVAPLVTLSGGQRTRAAIAALFFTDADMLLLDEPSNDLDADGRLLLRDRLDQWQKGAIIVSHDRALLETMDAIVELTTLGAARYGGNWSAYQARKAIEAEADARTLATADRRIAQAARDAQSARERQQRRDGAGARKGARGDMPRILIGQRKNRAEQTGGGHARLAERQQADAQEAGRIARAKVEHVEPITVALPPTGLPPHRHLLEIDAVTAGHLPDRPILHTLSLHITGPERIALTGPNGAGKSTLLALINGTLLPSSGTVRRHARIAMLDQRAALLDPGQDISENFARLNPDQSANACRTALAAFRFRGDAALAQVATLSGGQTLRAALACILGATRPPELLILDEPTNHLDLDSIQAVEAGLRGYDGALLVVSHDPAFLDAIDITRRLDLRDGRIRLS